jgi:hypothetical protein
MERQEILPEKSKHQFDLAKLRIEDCAHERESIRGLEWRFFFEANAAYAAIAISFFKIHEEYKHSLLLLGTGIAVTVVVTFAAWRLLKGAHRRLYEVQRLKYRYFDYLHEMTGLRDLRFSDDELSILVKESQVEEFPFCDVAPDIGQFSRNISNLVRFLRLCVDGCISPRGVIRISADGHVGDGQKRMGYPAEKMKAWKVGKAVGNTRNNEASLIEPLNENVASQPSLSLFE